MIPSLNLISSPAMKLSQADHRKCQQVKPELNSGPSGSEDKSTFIPSLCGLRWQAGHGKSCGHKLQADFYE